MTKNKKIKKRYKELIISLVVLALTFIYTNYFSDINLESIYTNHQGNKQPATSTRKINVNSNLSVTFLDVGQADCILIDNNGEYGLIDAGNNEDGKKIVAYFKDLGITNFKYVIGTHAHEDHIGGMDDVINNFKVDNFYMPDVITTTKTFEDVVVALEDNNVAFSVPEVDSIFDIGEARLKVIYVGDESKDLNDTSIVLKMTFGNNSFLFTGDATSDVEEKILSKDISSDVLKVGHHGSTYSTTNKFLDRVNPKYAVIQVGKNNSYKHPGSTTLDKLNNHNTTIYRTDIDGTIIAVSDGNNINFSTKRTDTNG